MRPNFSSLRHLLAIAQIESIVLSDASTIRMLGYRSEAYQFGATEEPVQDALRTILRSGDTFYDIGACVGFFSLCAASLVSSSGSIIAFEPVAENVRTLRINAWLNGIRNIKTKTCAISNRETRSDIQITRHPGGATLVESGERPSDSIGTRKVDVRTIDGMVRDGEIPGPTLIKLDVEGNEIAALEGMAQTVKIFRPALIYEVDDVDEGRANKKLDQIEGLLNSWSYSIKRLANAYPDSRSIVIHGLALPSPAR